MKKTVPLQFDDLEYGQAYLVTCSDGCSFEISFREFCREPHSIGPQTPKERAGTCYCLKGKELSGENKELRLLTDEICRVEKIE